MMVRIFLILLLSAAPASAQVALNVNQTHTLSWDWESTGSSVSSFVFRCGKYTKEIVDANARSLRFGSLIDGPGVYTGCTLTAKNEAGYSMPAIVPDFAYSYSYQALATFILELIALGGAILGVVSVYGRRAMILGLRYMSSHLPHAQPLALPEPVIVLEKGRDYAHRA